MDYYIEQDHSADMGGNSTGSGSAVGPVQLSGTGGGRFGKLKVTTTHRDFLTSNATSHTWAFSAVAELCDNAMDARAKECHLDLDYEHFYNADGSILPALIVMDTGIGMEPDVLLNALGLGHSHKPNPGITRGASTRLPIGYAGNGLKSSSMHLAKDLLVFTKTKHTQSVGMLSRTFLEKSGGDSIRVPLMTWDLAGNCLIRDREEVSQNLDAIKEYADLWGTEARLKEQLHYIASTGTILIMTGLKQEGSYELTWHDADPRVPEDDLWLHSSASDIGSGTAHGGIPVQRSLRRYLEVLYKEPTMVMTLCGINVRTRRVAASLQQRLHYDYRPTVTGGTDPGKVKITVGFYPEEGLGEGQRLEHTFSALMYYHNRLITPFKYISTTKGKSAETQDPRGRKAVAIVDVDWIKPVHNKQEFRDPGGAYRTLLAKLKETLELFWESRVILPLHEAAKQPSSAAKSGEGVEIGTWVQCVNCLKWRRMPPRTKFTDPTFDDDWECSQNPDKSLAKKACSADQEPDEDEEQERREHKKLKNSVKEMRKKRSREGAAAAAAGAADGKRRRLEEARLAAEVESARAAAAQATKERLAREEERQRQELLSTKLVAEKKEREEKEAEKQRQAAERREKFRRERVEREALVAAEREAAAEARRQQQAARDAAETVQQLHLQQQRVNKEREQQLERQQRQQALTAKRALQAERAALSAAAAASLREQPATDGSSTPLQQQPANASGTPQHHHLQGDAQQQQGEAQKLQGGFEIVSGRGASRDSLQAVAGTASAVLAPSAMGIAGGGEASLQCQQASGKTTADSAATAITQPASAQRQQAAPGSLVAAEASQQRSGVAGNSPGADGAETALFSARLAAAPSAAVQPASLREQLQSGGTALTMVPPAQQQLATGFAAAADVTGAGQAASGGAASDGAQADPGNCAEAGRAHSMPTTWNPAALEQGKGKEQAAAQQPQPTPASISSPEASAGEVLAWVERRFAVCQEQQLQLSRTYPGVGSLLAPLRELREEVAAALVRERESAQIALAAKDTELEQLRSALDQARLQGHKVAKENRNLS